MSTDGKQIREMVNEVKALKENKRYYSIFNIQGEYNNGIPLYFIAETKEETIDMLNSFVRENIPLINQFEYFIRDLDEEVRSYMGKTLDHYISDDWSMVTSDENVFKSDLVSVKQHTKVTPKLYSKS